jgi:hypothetical protein
VARPRLFRFNSLFQVFWAMLNDLCLAKIGWELAKLPTFPQGRFRSKNTPQARPEERYDDDDEMTTMDNDDDVRRREERWR